MSDAASAVRSSACWSPRAVPAAPILKSDKPGVRPEKRVPVALLASRQRRQQCDWPEIHVAVSVPRRNADRAGAGWECLAYDFGMSVVKINAITVPRERFEEFAQPSGTGLGRTRVRRL